MRIITTMYRPESEEETQSLISATINVTFMDARVVDIFLPLTPATARPYNPEEESLTSYTLRAWQSLLPSHGDSGQAHILRTQYGWTKKEVWLIVSLLNIAQGQLIHLTMDAPLEGTRHTLLRDALTISSLRNRWLDLLLGSKDSEEAGT
jgi:hypothetical protein